MYFLVQTMKGVKRKGRPEILFVPFLKPFVWSWVLWPETPTWLRRNPHNQGCTSVGRLTLIRWRLIFYLQSGTCFIIRMAPGIWDSAPRLWKICAPHTHTHTHTHTHVMYGLNDLGFESLQRDTFLQNVQPGWEKTVLSTWAPDGQL